MTSKFEQLIEYVINDEEAKAKELFHDIVVEKSREIYENLMNEESEEELDESEEEELDEESDAERNDNDELHEEDEELDETAMMDDESMMDGVEAEEEGMEMQEGEGEENIEDRVVDLEDKLDELMAEFESLMGNEHGDSVSDMDGGDDLEMDDTETAEFGNGEEESDSEELDMMAENVALDKAPAPVTSEPAGTQTKSTVAFNSGAKGMQCDPVKMTGDTAQGRPAPKTGDLP